eukprot:UN32314
MKKDNITNSINESMSDITTQICSFSGYSDQWCSSLYHNNTLDLFGYLPWFFTWTRYYQYLANTDGQMKSAIDRSLMRSSVKRVDEIDRTSPMTSIEVGMPKYWKITPSMIHQSQRQLGDISSWYYINKKIENGE